MTEAIAKQVRILPDQIGYRTNRIVPARIRAGRAQTIFKGLKSMLVLSREVGETIIITAPDGTRITLMLVEVRGDKSRIGIEAPIEFRVNRGEVQAAMDAA